MDFQNRVGTRFGRGSGISASESNVDRRERLRKLALETIDLAKDPYFLKNHLGSFECKLCLTIHTNEGSYLAHTQGKKHQTHLMRRAARDSTGMVQNIGGKVGDQSSRAAIVGSTDLKIGRPGYRVTKVRDSSTMQLGLLFQIYLPELKAGTTPRHRFMSSYEQRIDPPSKHHQYLIFAAVPYETIAFRVPSDEIVQKGSGSRNGVWSWWDSDAGVLHLQLFFAKSGKE